MEVNFQMGRDGEQTTNMDTTQNRSKNKRVTDMFVELMKHLVVLQLFSIIISSVSSEMFPVKKKVTLHSMAYRELAVSFYVQIVFF